MAAQQELPAPDARVIDRHLAQASGGNIVSVDRYLTRAELADAFSKMHIAGISPLV